MEQYRQISYVFVQALNKDALEASGLCAGCPSASACEKAPGNMPRIALADINYPAEGTMPYKFDQVDGKLYTSSPELYRWAQENTKCAPLLLHPNRDLYLSELTR